MGNAIPLWTGAADRTTITTNTDDNGWTRCVRNGQVSCGVDLFQKSFSDQATATGTNKIYCCTDTTSANCKNIY